MLSDTLSAGLEHYRIGPKIRALRLKKKLGLAQLGEHSGLSPALLSKIERGQLFPTLPTLLRIAMVFGVGLEHFFAADAERPLMAVVRRAERLRMPDRADSANPAYYFESLNFPVSGRKMEAYVASFPPSGPTSVPHAHPGAELIYVISGAIQVTIAGETERLEAGDAVYFDSSALHSYATEGEAAATAVVATTGA